jgi:hypothetical protein
MAGGEENAGFLPRFAFSDSFPPRYPGPAHRETGVTTSLAPRPKTTTCEVCPIPLAGILNRLLGGTVPLLFTIYLRLAVYDYLS